MEADPATELKHKGSKLSVLSQFTKMALCKLAEFTKMALCKPGRFLEPVFKEAKVMAKSINSHQPPGFAHSEVENRGQATKQAFPKILDFLGFFP